MGERRGEMGEESMFPCALFGARGAGGWAK